MSIGRLRSGELLAGAGAVVLLGSLFADWFGVDLGAASRLGDVVIGPAHSSGWDALGWLVLALAAAAIALAGWLVVATATVRPVTQVVAADVLTATIGSVAFVVLALRAVVFQPGPNELVTVKAGAWIGLAGALLLAVGAWWSLADERTDAPESTYVPPAPRPAPPARAS